MNQKPTRFFLSKACTLLIFGMLVGRIGWATDLACF